MCSSQTICDGVSSSSGNQFSRFRRWWPRFRRTWKSVQDEIFESEDFKKFRHSLTSKFGGHGIIKKVQLVEEFKGNPRVLSLFQKRIPAICFLSYREDGDWSGCYIFPVDENLNISSECFLVIKDI